jgi:hypothetical protein
MRHAQSLALCSMIIALSACGGGSTDPDPVRTTPSPPPPPPVTTVIAQGAFTGLPPRVAAFLPFTVTAAGSLEVAVDWTFATNDVDVFVVQGTNPCTVAQFNAGTCPFLAFSASATAKPERVTVASVSAGPHTVYVANFGTSEEAVSFQILLTTNPASSSADRGASAMSIEPKAPLLRMQALR